MMHAGAIMGPIDRSSTQKGAGGGSITPNPVHDLNVPYEGTEEYETPTADLLFPPVRTKSLCVEFSVIELESGVLNSL